MDNRVVHFEIQADDIERAKKFYQNVFGWEIQKWGGQGAESDYGVSMDYWGLVTGKSNPGINGGMYKRGDNPTRKINTFDCTINVSDIDKAIEAIKANGGKIEPWEGKEKWEMAKIGWFTRAVDSEGNMFGVLQPTDWKPEA